MSTLKEISQEHMSNMREQIFKHLVDNYNERAFTMDELVNDEAIKGCMITKKQVKDKKVEKKISQSSPKVSNEERQSQGFNKDKCKCRIWKNGLDNIQCSRKKKDGTDFCGGEKHNEGWWLGSITEPRPEEPIGGTKNTRHYWHDQEIPKKSKKTPSKVEKDKKVDKPKRKVKKESTEVTVATEVVVAIVEKIIDESVEESVEESEIPEGAGVGVIPPANSMVSKNVDITEDNSDVESVSSSDEDEQVEDFDYEGVIYKKLPADNMILNRRCGRQLGILLEDGTIEFFGEEEKAVHIKNKE